MNLHPLFRLAGLSLTMVLMAMPLVSAPQRRAPATKSAAAPAVTPAPAKRPDVSSIPIYGTSASSSSASNSAGADNGTSQTAALAARQRSNGRLFAALQAGNHRVNTLAGLTLALNRVLGENRPTVIIFWSTYCGVCFTALDDWQAIYERYGQRGLNLIALNVQDPGDRDEVKAFMSQHRLGFPVYFAPRELHAQLTEGRLGTPVTFVFDREGNLAARLAGWTRGQGRQALDNVARGILAE